MEKSPAFQWYPKDYLTSEKVATMDLKTEGAYRRALDYCWLNGSLPADEKKLALLIGKGCTVKIARELIPLFVPDPDDSDRLLHKRLEEERVKQMLFREKQSSNGSRGGRPKKETKKTEITENKQVNEVEEKGLGFFGETQTKAKKSSPISNLQSPISFKENNIKEDLVEGKEDVEQLTLNGPSKERKKVPPKKERKAFVPPTVEETIAEMLRQKPELGNEWCSINASKLVNHYTLTEWKYGKAKTPIKSLVHLVSNWITNNWKGAPQNTTLPKPILTPTKRY